MKKGYLHFYYALWQHHFWWAAAAVPLPLSPQRQQTESSRSTWYSGGKTAVNVFQEIVDDFNASQDEYEVATTTQADYTETYEKLQAGIAGKNAPDMALLDTDKSRNLSEKNLVADINEFVDADDEFDKEDYVPVFYDQGVDADGKLLPFRPTELHRCSTTTSRSLPTQGSTPPTIKTWQDLEAAAEKITNRQRGWMGAHVGLREPCGRSSQQRCVSPQRGRRDMPDQLQRVGGRMGELPQMDPTTTRS